ncbi:unnamed protein product [Thelazia callipaeda]|uniref:TDP43_N domain-containing protein n=1 Tax=Thelazia callipaeda TaxID=103827 RepID=A0A0N5CT83_THECL|nr:unnamed protein product [Thelazia callipaeda]
MEVMPEKKLCKVHLVDVGHETVCPFDRLYSLKNQPSYILQAPQASFLCFLDSDSWKLAATNEKQNQKLIISSEIDGIYTGKFKTKSKLGNAADEGFAVLLSKMVHIKSTNVQQLSGKEYSEQMVLEKLLQENLQLQHENAVERKEKIQALAEKAKIQAEKDRLLREYQIQLMQEREKTRLALAELHKVNLLQTGKSATNLSRPLMPQTELFSGTMQPEITNRVKFAAPVKMPLTTLAASRSDVTNTYSGIFCLLSTLFD